MLGVNDEGEEVAEAVVVEDVGDGEDAVVARGPSAPRGPQPGQPMTCPSPAWPAFPAAALAVQGGYGDARREVTLPFDAQSPSFVAGTGGWTPC